MDVLSILHDIELLNVLPASVVSPCVECIALVAWLVHPVISQVNDSLSPRGALRRRVFAPECLLESSDVYVARFSDTVTGGLFFASPSTDTVTAAWTGCSFVGNLLKLGKSAGIPPLSLLFISATGLSRCRRSFSRVARSVGDLFSPLVELARSDGGRLTTVPVELKESYLSCPLDPLSASADKASTPSLLPEFTSTQQGAA